MKIKKQLLNLLAGISLFFAFHLQSADSTNSASIQESWEIISNRWGSVPLEKITQTAEHGDVSAQFYLSIAYSDGNGVATNQAEAFKWTQLAAQQGMARAQRNLGWMFMNGNGTATNAAEAAVWYHKAAQQGSPTAQRIFGWMLQTGSGVETNVSEAVEWYQKAAQQGDAQAQFNLGWMYENGVNFPQDYAEAAKFYRQAAGQGHSMAQNNLGWLYKNGWGVTEDDIEAVKWFQKSAEQGDNLAAYNLAWIYASGTYGATNTFGQGAEAQIRSGGVAPNHELAEKWMRQAVDLNSAEGQCQFGDLLHGEFDNAGHQDTTRFSDAGEWYRKAAEQGYAKAEEKLAEMYNYGQLGDDQRSNCIPWFLKAAAQGNADAQTKIGELRQLYPDSELLKSINPIDSLKQAAIQGALQAQFELARRYHTGDGVPKDSTESFKWMEMAAQHDISPVTWTIDAHYYLVSSRIIVGRD